jgi:hypothetical protein
VYRCPKCSSANLEVVVEVWATLIQNDDGFETDTTTPDDASHEWTDNSVMRCCDCDSQEIAERFNTESGTPKSRPLGHAGRVSGSGAPTRKADGIQ